MKRFNLSEWALAHQPLIRYLIVALAIVGAEYVLRIVPKGTHDVKKFIKPAELIGWVDQTTLKERHIIGLHYNPLTNTFKLAPGVDVNYMLHTTAKQD